MNHILNYSSYSKCSNFYTHVRMSNKKKNSKENKNLSTGFLNAVLKRSRLYVSYRKRNIFSPFVIKISIKDQLLKIFNLINSNISIE